MQRFFVTPECCAAETVHLTGDQAHQIAHVLRLGPGDRIVVLDGRGQAFEVLLETVSGRAVTGRVTAERAAAGEPETRLTLFQGLLRRDKFEWVLQKATEVGVTRIVPVVTERSLVRATGPLKPARRQRWVRILTEAAEQCQRGRVPSLAEPVAWAEAVSLAASLDRSLVACPRAGGQDLGTALAGAAAGASLGLLIGPEGGLTAAEVDQARAGGLLPVDLGPRILRTETAAIVAASLVLYAVGDMRPANPGTSP